MQVTKAEHHRVVRDALTKLNSATVKVGGGRDEQLDALKQRITWTTYESVLLSMPLLCFIVTPQRFDTSYRSKQPYTQNGRPSQAQVSYSPELSSVLIYVPLMLSDDSALQAHQFAALPLQGEIVHQCVVKLPLEAIVRDCSNPVAVDKFKRLVEELADEYPAQDMEIEIYLDAAKEHIEVQGRVYITLLTASSCTDLEPAAVFVCLLCIHNFDLKVFDKL